MKTLMTLAILATLFTTAEKGPDPLKSAKETIRMAQVAAETLTSDRDRKAYWTAIEATSSRELMKASRSVKKSRHKQ